MRGSSPRMTTERASLLPQLRQLARDRLLSVDDFGDVADAVDIAFGIPRRLEQNARLVLRRDRHAVQRSREHLAVELAELLGRIRDRVDAGVALDAVVIGHVPEARVELGLELRNR